MLTPWVVFDADPGLPGAFAVLSLESEFLSVLPDMDIDGRVRGVFLGVEDQAKDAITPGEQRSFTRRYTASAGDDMAGVTKNVLELLGMQSGSRYLQLGISEGSEVRVELDVPRQARASFHRLDPARYLDQEGKIRDGGVMPMTTAWTDGVDPGLGTWLSLGRYAVEIESAGYQGQVCELDVQAGLEDYGLLSLGTEPLHPIRLQLHDDAGLPNDLPLRISVVGLGGTPDPQLGRFDQAPGQLAAGRRIWTDADELELRLPEGAYRFIASRGPRFPLASAELRVPVDASLDLTLEAAVIDAVGRVDADPFTASWASIFGGDEAADIAFALCAEGIDFTVRAEVGGGGGATPGCEGQQVVSGSLATLDVPRTGTSMGDGWMVGFPVQDELPAAGLGPGSWLDLAHDAGAQVTAILAPRAKGAAGAASGMFHARGLERDHIDDGEANRFLREASERGTVALDAGAIEILSARDPEHTAQALQDWLALLQAGYPLFPIAASHSSWLQHDLPGAARTLVLTQAETIEGRLADLASGHVLVSSGPVLEAELRGAAGLAGPGDTLIAQPGEGFELDIRLRAADWVPVDRVRVFQDGVEVWSSPIDEQGAIDITRTIRLQSAGPGWVVVDAGRPEEQPSGDFALVYPRMPIYAATAPIYLDTSGP